jgi:hypothetical protein
MNEIDVIYVIVLSSPRTMVTGNQFGRISGYPYPFYNNQKLHFDIY